MDILLLVLNLTFLILWKHVYQHHSFCFRLYLLDRAFATAFYLGIIWLLCSWSDTVKGVFDCAGSYARHLPVVGSLVPITNWVIYIILRCSYTSIVYFMQIKDTNTIIFISMVAYIYGSFIFIETCMAGGYKY